MPFLRIEHHNLQRRLHNILPRRLEELQLPGLQHYRLYLEDNPLEWHILDAMCRITISRFYRDQGIYNALRSQVLPALIENARGRGDNMLSCWCIGAASGEEPYSVSLLWELSGLKKQGTDLKILATEVDPLMIQRAGKGCYPASSIKELPAKVTALAFTQEDAQFCLHERYRERVRFLQQDIRNEQPDSSFDLILCRNLVFTYFSLEQQEGIAWKILRRLKKGGGLVIGSHEELPGSLPGLKHWLSGRTIYRREG